MSAIVRVREKMAKSELIATAFAASVWSPFSCSASTYEATAVGHASSIIAAEVSCGERFSQAAVK